MIEIEESCLVAAVKRDSQRHPASIPTAEIRFWSDSAENEERYISAFVRQPGFVENMKLSAGPISILTQHLENFGKPPADVRREAGRQMATLEILPSQYPLPNNRKVLIQMVCGIRRHLNHNLDTRDMEQLTKGAVVFNVRFQLGRKFSREQFFSALNKFLKSRTATNAKKIKIAFWAHDLEGAQALEDQKHGHGLALRRITELGMALAELCPNAELIALERRVMSKAERERQKRMHTRKASSVELSNINWLLSGTSNPL